MAGELARDIQAQPGDHRTFSPQLVQDIIKDLKADPTHFDQTIQHDNQLLQSMGLGNFQIVGMVGDHLITTDGQIVKDSGTGAPKDRPDALPAPVENLRKNGSPDHERVVFNDIGKPGDENHTLYGGTRRTIHRGEDGRVTGIDDLDRNGQSLGSIKRNDDGTFTRCDKDGKPIEKIHDLHVTKNGALEYTNAKGEHVYQHVIKNGQALREITPADGSAAKTEPVDPNEKGNDAPHSAEAPAPPSAPNPDAAALQQANQDHDKRVKELVSSGDVSQDEAERQVTRQEQGERAAAGDKTVKDWESKLPQTPDTKPPSRGELLGLSPDQITAVENAKAAGDQRSIDDIAKARGWITDEDTKRADEMNQRIRLTQSGGT